METARTVVVPSMPAPISMGMTMARKIREGAPIVLDQQWLEVPEHPPNGPDAHVRQHAFLRSGF
jgi:hypothetical protein